MERLGDLIQRSKFSLLVENGSSWGPENVPSRQDVICSPRSLLARGLLLVAVTARSPRALECAVDPLTASALLFRGTLSTLLKAPTRASWPCSLLQALIKILRCEGGGRGHVPRSTWVCLGCSHKRHPCYFQATGRLDIGRVRPLLSSHPG